MKRNILNKTYWIAALMLLFFAACSNETETPGVELPKTYNIRVSVRSGNELTRTITASDLIAQEKIKRFDIFIYEPGDAGSLVKYIGGTSDAGYNDITASFESSTDFTTPKDIYVVVNNAAWSTNGATAMKAISKATLKNAVLDCVQNAEYDAIKTDSIIAFNGYKKDTTKMNNEPFVMSTFKTDYNFSSAGNSTLELVLKRTYAKAILTFKTNLDATEDADWIELKELTVSRICNIPKTTKLFMETGNGYEPQHESYNYVSVKGDSLTNINANLSGGKTYPLDTFAPDRLALRLFPHDVSADVDNQATCLFVDFAVGPTGSTEITKRFKRRINIGDAGNNFQIDPNYAYVITISYGKTTNSITTNCRIIPWNLLYFEDEVEPD
ncbi:hypothetical protein [uncultured Bacteroides sp.]|uniref:hypothetical protein n=1 Tax=uncultured Bacteroides sp. TaxID=162156 RepID=UPI0025D23E08|nr:hypothetical protein [uncultured Bacteroides sp.]